MKTSRLESADGFDPFWNPLDFSLIRGGPAFLLLRQLRLTDDALGLVGRRIVVISLICWLPLLVLSSVQHVSTAVPFLLDVEVHVRFLFVVPLLIGAERVVHRRMRFVAKEFLDRHLIPESAMTRFKTAVVSSFRLRNSVLAEFLLLAFVYVFGILILWRHYMAFGVATWYATPSTDRLNLSWAGIWYGYVGLPIFQFLLCRWYFRLFIWARFLWKVSHIDLSLVPTHPDRAGGLGFLSEKIYAFVPVVIAHGALLAGLLGNRIYHLGAKLPDFTLEISALVIFLMCIVLGPLLMLAPQLAHAKRIGRREYGSLAGRYVREFDAKWVRGGAAGDEPLLGSPDIQSLADMGNSFEVIRTIRIVPFTRETILMLAAAALAPIAPLLLTVISLDELLKKLLGIWF